MPLLLKQHGYVTQGVGKWHMGENQGSLPQNVGYDDYVGFLGVSDMYTEWRDVYFNPEVALTPERFKMMENDDLQITTRSTARRPTRSKCENGKLIELDYIKDLDQHWLDTSLAFLDKMKGGKQPFYPLPRDAWLPFRHLSVRRVGRKVDGAHRVQRLLGADGLHAREIWSTSSRRSASSRTR